MGPLDHSNYTSEDLEPEHATTSNGNEAIVNPAIVDDEFIQSGRSFASCSSSISSDSSPLQEHDKPSSKLEADDQLQKSNEESNDSPPPNDSISKSPPIQLMEREETPKYRVPSHVFSRKKSTTPGDWSMASNESLFSIQMGSIRFYNQDSFLFKSEEPDLGYDTQFVDDKTTETGKIPQFDEVSNQGSTMLDEHEPTNSDNKEDCQSWFSTDSSNSSSISFVFPVVAGETEKGGSPNPHNSLGPAPEPEESETKKATPFIGWFPCFRYKIL